MPQIIDRDFIAEVLIESVYSTDELTCKKYGIGERTLSRYRKMVASDAELADKIRTKRKAFDEAWAEQIPVVLRKAIRFIERATEVADPRNPAVIERITGAIKVIAEVQMTGKFIDARIGAGDRETSQLSGQGDASLEVSGTRIN